MSAQIGTFDCSNVMLTQLFHQFLTVVAVNAQKSTFFNVLSELSAWDSQVIEQLCNLQIDALCGFDIASSLSFYMKKNQLLQCTLCLILAFLMIPEIGFDRGKSVSELFTIFDSE